MNDVVGVDLGGTKIAAAVVTADGALGEVCSSPTPATRGSAAILDAVERLVRDAAGRRPIAGLGVGTAGVVDAAAGRIVSSTDAITDWAGTEVAAGLRTRLVDLVAERPVVVVNDVDAHGVGEAWLGAATGERSVLMVAVGTGVGASVILGGKPLRGAHHVAGEMGHMPSPDAAGLRCGCGRTGHLEALGSGPALHRHYLRLGGDRSVADTRAVVALADAGDDLATRVVAASATAVGRAIAGVVTVLDPGVVVVGGGMSGVGPLWWGPMTDTLRVELIEPLVNLPVVPSTLGGSAAILGAARCALTAPAPRH